MCVRILLLDIEHGVIQILRHFPGSYVLHVQIELYLGKFCRVYLLDADIKRILRINIQIDRFIHLRKLFLDRLVILLFLAG